MGALVRALLPRCAILLLFRRPGCLSALGVWLLQQPLLPRAAVVLLCPPRASVTPRVLSRRTLWSPMRRLCPIPWISLLLLRFLWRLLRWCRLPAPPPHPRCRRAGCWSVHPPSPELPCLRVLWRWRCLLPLLLLAPRFLLKLFHRSLCLRLRVRQCLDCLLPPQASLLTCFLCRAPLSLLLPCLVLVLRLWPCCLCLLAWSATHLSPSTAMPLPPELAARPPSLKLSASLAVSALRGPRPPLACPVPPWSLRLQLDGRCPGRLS